MVIGFIILMQLGTGTLYYFQCTAVLDKIYWLIAMLTTCILVDTVLVGCLADKDKQIKQFFTAVGGGASQSTP